MHIAAAVGTDLVALFAVHNPRRYGPYTDPARYRTLRAEDAGGAPGQGLGALEPEIVFEATLAQLNDAAGVSSRG